MKKECEYTRKYLRRYLRGHLFKPEQIRIDRHINTCVLCRSEFQALKRAAETQKIIRDITPPEGVVQKMRAGVSGLSIFKKLIYRPLWVIGVASFAAAIYFFIVAPFYRIRENEAMSIPMAAVSTPASGPLSVSSVPPPAELPATPSPLVSAPKGPEQQKPALPARIERFRVTISVADDQTAVEQINAILREHATLNTLRFSGSGRELSGSLSAGELLSLFDRMRTVGTLRYRQTVFATFSSSDMVPFSIVLKKAPKSIERTAQDPAAKQTSINNKSDDKPAVQVAPQ